MSEFTSDPDLVAELAPYRKWMAGRILNAGCGKRFIDFGTQSVRLDINPQFATKVDIQADVHFLPFANESFETVISIAVLEHTKYAWDVAKEFHRILSPGGKAIIAIPFIQPGHGSPYDYVRFTKDGIQALVEWASFQVIEVNSIHPFAFNLEWMLRELLLEYPKLRSILRPVRTMLFPRMRQGAFFPKHIQSLQSAYCVVAEKSK